MQIDGTEADIKSIIKSGKVDTLETIRLEMIDMLRITEDQGNNGRKTQNRS